MFGRLETLKKLTEGAPIYLSIDMDFWQGGITAKDAGWLFDLVDIAEEYALPIDFEEEHHHLMPKIPKNTQVIWNIDAHDDIIGSTYELTDGTWGYHVELERHHSFIWVYPDSTYMGICDSEINVYRTKHPKWQYVKRMRRPQSLFELMSWSEIDRLKLLTGIGICLSPKYQTANYPQVVNTAMYEELKSRAHSFYSPEKGEETNA